MDESESAGGVASEEESSLRRRQRRSEVGQQRAVDLLQGQVLELARLMTDVRFDEVVVVEWFIAVK
jgi:hypothetical protein